jgi:RNA polymerase sigma-70 factor (ECF subfamily)
VHCQRALTGVTHWAALRQLYGLLAVRAPTLGVLVSRAAVTAEAGDPAHALVQLDALPQESAGAYQPYWVTRAHILKRLGHAAEASASLSHAIRLTKDRAILDYLERREQAE